MDQPTPTVPDIEQAVRDYLRRHPNAVDTERGIGEWWLQGMRQRCSAADVRLAISALVAGGVLVERRLPDGQLAYASPQLPPDLH